MQSRKNRRGYPLMLAGALLLLAALLLTAYNLWDSRRADQVAKAVADQLLEQIPTAEQRSHNGAALPDETAAPPSGTDAPSAEIPAYQLYPDMEMPVLWIDGSAYIGLLTIPALDLSLPVMSQWSYPNLKLAPCRFSGSAYTENLVIAGHNYQGHFQPLLGLEPGVCVFFTDVDGNRFCYQVAETEVLRPTAVEEMENSGWALTLFTCTYGGRTRFTVRCKAVTEY